MLWTSVATQFKATANGAVDRTTNAFQEIEIVGLSWHWLVESCCIQVFYLWILPCSDIILLKTYDSFPATPTHWKVGKAASPFNGAGTDKGNWADLLGNSVVSSGFFQQKCTCNEGASNSSSCTILHAGSVLSRSLRQHLLNPYLPNFMAGQPTPPLTYPEIASLRIRAYENIWKPLVSLK